MPLERCGRRPELLRRRQREPPARLRRRRVESEAPESSFREGSRLERNATGLLTRGSLPRRLPGVSASGVVAGERLPSQRRDRPGLAPGSLTAFPVSAEPIIGRCLTRPHATVRVCGPPVSDTGEARSCACGYPSWCG